MLSLPGERRGTGAEMGSERFFLSPLSSIVVPVCRNSLVWKYVCAGLASRGILRLGDRVGVWCRGGGSRNPTLIVLALSCPSCLSGCGGFAASCCNSAQGSRTREKAETQLSEAWRRSSAVARCVQRVQLCSLRDFGLLVDRWTGIPGSLDENETTRKKSNAIRPPNNTTLPKFAMLRHVGNLGSAQARMTVQVRRIISKIWNTSARAPHLCSAPRSPSVSSRFLVPVDLVPSGPSSLP